MAEIHIHIQISRSLLRPLVAVALLFGVCSELASESVTLTTYYPAPSGVYNQMITTANTFLARDGGKVGIGTANTPFSKVQMVSQDIGTSLSFFTSTYDGGKTWGSAIYKTDIGGGVPLRIDTQNVGTWFPSASFDHGQSAGHPSFVSYYATELARNGGNVSIGTPPGAGAVTKGDLDVSGPTGVATVRQAFGAAACREVTYAFGGTVNCNPGNEFATMVSGLQAQRWDLGPVGVQGQSGAFLCCPCGPAGCAF